MTSGATFSDLIGAHDEFRTAKHNGVILIGMQCSGKTSLGKALTEIIKPSPLFIDTDDYFIRQYTSIADFIDKKKTEASEQGLPNPHEYAWRSFREEEKHILHCVKEQTCTGLSYILSTGGGIVANVQTPEIARSNAKLLRTMGTVFYLTPADNLEHAAGVLASRYDSSHQSSTHRPNQGYEQKTYDRMFAMLSERDGLYREAAHHTIVTGDKSPRIIAEDIVIKVNEAESISLSH